MLGGDSAQGFTTATPPPPPPPPPPPLPSPPSPAQPPAPTPTATPSAPLQQSQSQTPISRGTRVELQDLRAKPQLNGAHGRTASCQASIPPPAGSWYKTQRLRNAGRAMGPPFRLKPANLRALLMMRCAALRGFVCFVFFCFIQVLYRLLDIGENR